GSEAAPPSGAMNSRRLIRSPRRCDRGKYSRTFARSLRGLMGLAMWASQPAARALSSASFNYISCDGNDQYRLQHRVGFEPARRGFLTTQPIDPCFCALASPRQLRDLAFKPGKVIFPNGVVRRPVHQANHNRLALAQRVECL